MANIIDIDIYSSPEDIGSPLRATSMRKPYTSLLYVLFFLTVGIVIYFYFSAHEYDNAIAEVPTSPKVQQKETPLPIVVKNNLAKWSLFVKGAVAFKPEILVSNGDEEFLCYFSAQSQNDAFVLKDSLRSIAKATQIVDTAVIDGKFTFIIRGKLKPAHQKNPLQSVKKFIRTTVMNFIDSLAVAKGISNPERIQIGTDKIKGGECFKYKMSARGNLLQIGRFFSDIIKITYSISPLAISIEQTDSLYSLEVIWGLYDFAQPSDTAKVAKK